MTTENTNSPTWKVCKTFNSALLEDEKEGERLNEILCANADEAECLVALLNNLDQEITEKTNEVARLRELLKRTINYTREALFLARTYDNKNQWNEVDRLWEEIWNIGNDTMD